MQNYKKFHLKYIVCAFITKEFYEFSNVWGLGVLIVLRGTVFRSVWACGLKLLWNKLDLCFALQISSTYVSFLFLPEKCWLQI